MIRIIFFVFSLLALNSCSASKNTKIALTKEISSIYDKKKFNGFAVSIVNREGALYQNGFGWADAAAQKKYTTKTVQNIGSVSKTFVGIAMMKAQELGKLKLDDPIDQYLDFKVANPKFPEVKITIRQLATHTSSIVDNEFYGSRNYYLKAGQNLQGVKMTFEDDQTFNASDSLISMRTYLENVLTENGKWNKESFSENSPGSIYEYSNVGTALAAYIIERATGQSFRDFTRQYILEPLKMKDSGWKFEEIDFSKYSRLYESPSVPLPYYELITYPDGGFITNVNDLGKYLSELIRGYNGKGKLLTDASYKEYYKPQLSESQFTERNTKNPYNESYNVGILMGFGYTGYIGHTGGDPGTMSMLFFDPKTGLGRIMILNTNFSDKEGNKVFFEIWNALEKYQKQLIPH
ncbi:serine hydrolase domain-containing protein [Chryseobacterium indologenes]|uniref:serine hydrolase domain-containing protein n=2 Tax=Chryseobacterium indologenes TaxID=253 RepID=UPI001625B379|nr:serine hydrolase domain-containing protein [Chryseobacterium indologenes]MBF6643902.1 beta-lactamase family protein [Chryseobacterium indologenes]QQQ72371.1 beta-lactamase family protein [Chryseobacterium indologenes]